MTHQISQVGVSYPQMEKKLVRMALFQALAPTFIFILFHIRQIIIKKWLFIRHYDKQAHLLDFPTKSFSTRKKKQIYISYTRKLDFRNRQYIIQCHTGRKYLRSLNIVFSEFRILQTADAISLILYLIYIFKICITSIHILMSIMLTTPSFYVYNFTFYFINS